LKLAITNTTDAGNLVEFTLGFCGEILEAEAPKGWTVTVLRRVASFGAPAEVQWTVSKKEDGLLRDNRSEGFSVTLKPGWRRAIAYYATWENSGGGSGSPHDCGELP
jgi:hypothetical protein